MTKNRSMRIAVLVLALALITCCFVGTTFAKYASEAEGTSTVNIASWSFTSGGTPIDDEIEFNLADLIYEYQTTDADTDVADDVIAPGTSGKGTFTIKNESQVNAYVTFEVDVPDLPDGMTISYDFKIGDAAATKDGANGYIVNMGDTLTVTVSWDWDFGDARDDNDLAGTSLDVTATLNMTQKN